MSTMPTSKSKSTTPQLDQLAQTIFDAHATLHVGQPAWSALSAHDRAVWTRTAEVAYRSARRHYLAERAALRSAAGAREACAPALRPPVPLVSERVRSLLAAVGVSTETYHSTANGRSADGQRGLVARRAIIDMLGCAGLTATQIAGEAGLDATTVRVHLRAGRISR